LTKIFQNYWKAFTILNLFIITFLSLYPLPELPSSAGSDKFHHFIAYFSLAISISIARPKNYKQFMLFFIFYGGFIEIIQPYVNRHSELLDFISSTLGVIASNYIGHFYIKFTK
jgi:VanZ family protein